MSVKEPENLRQILLAVVFGVLPCLLAISVIGQSEPTDRSVEKAPPASDQ